MSKQTVEIGDTGNELVSKLDHNYDELFSNTPLNVMSYGAVGNGITDDTLSIQSAIDQAAVLKISVVFPSGIFLFSSLSIQVSNILLIGNGIGNTILKKDSTLVDAISIGTESPVQNITFQDLEIQGNSSCANGIVLGHELFVTNVAFFRLERVKVHSFSKVGYAGLKLNFAQEVVISKALVTNNYYGIYLDENSAVTTFIVRDQCYIGANSIGFYSKMLKEISTGGHFIFEDTIFEGNDKEAIKSIGTAAIIKITDGYFEANAISGPGAITISGGSGPYESTQLFINGGDLQYQGIGCTYFLSLDYVQFSVIEKCSKITDLGVITTANCDVTFRNNGGVTAGAVMAKYRLMLGHITAEETELSDGIVINYNSVGNYFENHIGVRQVVKPTVIVNPSGNAGVGASVSITDGSTDTNGRITFISGTSAWETGIQFTLTFNKLYRFEDVPPVVILQLESAGSTASKSVYVSSDENGFSVNYPVAEDSQKTIIFTYFVIG